MSFAFEQIFWSEEKKGKDRQKVFLLYPCFNLVDGHMSPNTL